MTETKKEEKAAKPEIQFSYIEKLRQSTDAVGEMINDYRDKYADQIITAGKDLAEGVKADASVIFEDVVSMRQRSDSKTEKTEKTEKVDTDAKATVRQEKSTEEKESVAERRFCPRRVIKNKTHQIISKLGEYKEKYAANTSENAELFISAVKADACKIVDDVSGSAKKIVSPKIPLKGLQKTITRSVDGVLSRIDLPQKQDIERLTQALETLNTKVDYLNKSKV
ncbi:phasin family protein [Desulfococcaceae bacterium HSG9]|nr:phasin family protein [Desulfococcaceae bacterium HSG9]